jgi:3-dehydroquinate synthase
VSRHTLRVPLAGRAYDVVVEPGVLDRAGTLVRPLLRSARVVIVTDSNLVATAHPARLEAALARSGLATAMVVVPAGEASKSWAGLQDLCERILAQGIDRRTALVALGGGVVGDLAGLAAALLLRGLDLVQIPTSLLAQVDSSVGGKTAIDSPRGKNLIGAFHQPKLVLIDPTVLVDLPPRELKAGYAELVKHAFIKDAALFAWLETHAPEALHERPEPLFWAEAVARSVAVKVAIVAEDEHETTGLRALLNFGHTFAHAFETLSGYGDRLVHGEAVALGMAKAWALSVRLGLASGQDAGRAVAHLRAAGLPTRLAEMGLAFRPDDVLAAMRLDKKAESGRLAFVVARTIGAAAVDRDIPDALVAALLAADA